MEKENMQMKQMQCCGKSADAHSNPIVTPEPLLHGNSGASAGFMNDVLLFLASCPALFHLGFFGKQPPKAMVRTTMQDEI